MNLSLFSLLTSYCSSIHCMPFSFKRWNSFVRTRPSSSNIPTLTVPGLMFIYYSIYPTACDSVSAD